MNHNQQDLGIPNDSGFSRNALGDDLDAHLATQEAKFTDIIPMTEKANIWVGEKGVKTPLSIIYTHGFSAMKYEIRPVPVPVPVPDRVAAVLGQPFLHSACRSRPRF